MTFAISTPTAAQKFSSVHLPTQAAGRADAAPWVRGLHAEDASKPDKAFAENPGKRVGGQVAGNAIQNAIYVVRRPLGGAEQQRSAQLAQMMAPRRQASPNFNALQPSTLRGPSSGRNYSITACPMGAPDAYGRRFTEDDMLDQAFKNGVSTTVSLTDRRDVPHSRHSDYYKQNKTDGKYSITTHGRPSFTTTVNSNGQPVSLSIYKNTVQNRQTGQIAHMNMVHIDGWRDQTTIDSGALLELQTKLRSKLNRSDMQNMLIHCSEGRNRTGEFLTGLEAISSVSRGRPPNVPGIVEAFRQARVSDAMSVPAQLKATGEMQVRLERMLNGQAHRAG